MNYIVELKKISHSFGGVQALNNANFDLRAGEVHALVGENGAGKSTLMKILGGSFVPNSGEILLSGQAATFKNPHRSLEAGISVIHQELALAEDLTVAENVFLGQLPTAMNWAALSGKAASLIENLGFSIHPLATIRDIPIAQRQVVEIAKALSRKSKVVIFDEPTAVLSTQDARRLLEVINTLKEQGTSIIYISHRLDEVLEIADRITVLKDGETVTTLEAEHTSVEKIIELMVGRKLSAVFGDPIEKTVGETVLKVRDLSRGETVKGVSFDLRKGEILGIGGLVGAGRTELVRLIFGADRADSGVIELNGEPVSIKSPKDAVQRKIGLVPESRKDQGVILNVPIKWNVTMSRLGPMSGLFGIIRRARENKQVNHLGQQVRLKAASTDHPVSSLSGGNQQKVVLAKWLHAEGEILIFDEPTRGVDVGAKTEIYTQIRSLAAAGKAIIVISSEHLELFGLCDRILVMREGAITGELQQDQFTETNMLSLAMLDKGAQQS